MLHCLKHTRVVPGSFQFRPTPMLVIVQPIMPVIYFFIHESVNIVNFVNS